MLEVGSLARLCVFGCARPENLERGELDLLDGLPEEFVGEEPLGLLRTPDLIVLGERTAILLLDFLCGIKQLLQ